MIDLKRYWWPLAPLAELDTSQPIARTLHGIPLVLFRDAEVGGEPLAATRISAILETLLALRAEIFRTKEA